jgi:hypothetical protein
MASCRLTLSTRQLTFLYHNQLRHPARARAPLAVAMLGAMLWTSCGGGGGGGTTTISEPGTVTVTSNGPSHAPQLYSARKSRGELPR